MMIEKYTAGATRLLAMRKIEVPVAPSLERCVIAGVMAVAGGAEAGMKIRRVLFCLFRAEAHRRQVAAAAEPAFRGNQHAGVKMRGWHQRALHVCHETDAAGPEVRILGRARDLGTEIRTEFAPDGGNVHPDFFEYAAFHQARDAAAAG